MSDSAHEVVAADGDATRILPRAVTPIARAAPSCRIGWYGKLPAAGDFLTRRLPDSFRQPWDAWLCAGMIDAKERCGDQWQQIFLSFPVWRFLWHAEGADLPLWSGVLLPGIDRVGRLFPLTVALPVTPASLAGDAPAALETHLSLIQSLALRVLVDDDIEGFDAALCALTPWPEQHAPEAAAAPLSTAAGTVLHGLDLPRWLATLGVQQWLSGSASTLFWSADESGGPTLRIETCPPPAAVFTLMVAQHLHPGRATP